MSGSLPVTHNGQEVGQATVLSDGTVSIRITDDFLSRQIGSSVHGAYSVEQPTLPFFIDPPQTGCEGSAAGLA